MTSKLANVGHAQQAEETTSYHWDYGKNNNFVLHITQSGKESVQYNPKTTNLRVFLSGHPSARRYRQKIATDSNAFNTLDKIKDEKNLAATLKSYKKKTNNISSELIKYFENKLAVMQQSQKRGVDKEAARLNSRAGADALPANPETLADALTLRRKKTPSSQKVKPAETPTTELPYSDKLFLAIKESSLSQFESGDSNSSYRKHYPEIKSELMEKINKLRPSQSEINGNPSTYNCYYDCCTIAKFDYFIDPDSFLDLVAKYDKTINIGKGLSERQLTNLLDLDDEELNHERTKPLFTVYNCLNPEFVLSRFQVHFGARVGLRKYREYTDMST